MTDKPKYIVGQASESDIESIAMIGKSFYGEGSLPGRFNADVFANSWHSFIDSGSGVIFHLSLYGEIVGAIGGLIYPDPNDGDLVASEFFWYVEKGHRGHGLELLYKFEDWAKSSGAKRIIMVHLSSLMPEAIKKIYQRNGYSELETSYIKSL